MKKILIVFLLCFCNYVYAIENVTIDGNNLFPFFDKEVFLYNYYTDNEKIIVYVDENEYEYKVNDGINVIDISDYKINVFKNYVIETSEYLDNLYIDGYDISFDRNVFSYDLYIGEEERLDIKCESTNSELKIDIIGNGNFNNSHNVIEVILHGKKEVTYTLNVYKSQSVSYVNEEKPIKFSDTKKEIVKVFVITISFVVIFLYYKYLF